VLVVSEIIYSFVKQLILNKQVKRNKLHIMKEKMVYYIVFTFWYLASLLPLRLLYFISDLLYYPLYYLLRYRRRVVRKNIAESFPNKNEDERRSIERGFYHYFCDYLAETIKFFSISEKEMSRRMTFGGMDEVREVLKERSVVLYLGHYCNWEWISSIPLHLGNAEGVVGGQIYHRLRNKAFDKLFLRARGRFGAVSLEMHSAMRSLVRLKQQKKRFIIGFISDQSPVWEYVNMWTDFLNHKTSFFVGAENIAKLTDAAVYYVDVHRVRRGYYHAEFVPMTDKPKDFSNYELTVAYGKMLERVICREPQYWLWSHNRWKRTYEQWMERQESRKQTADHE
jgi:KDO2-lipid IV(A) lauroyltransferase